jgi:fibronectin-binding autotransporter adhesin
MDGVHGGAARWHHARDKFCVSFTSTAMLASVLFLLCQCPISYGQTWVGPNNNANDPGTGTWSVGTNWSTGGVVSNRLNTFVFNTGTNNYSATDDINLERFQLNSITFGRGAGVSSFTIQGDAADGSDPSLRFLNDGSGAGPSITNNAGTASTYIRNDSFIDPGSTLTFGGTGTGRTTITGVIGGTGALAVTSSALAIDSTLTATNFSTFTGGITQTGGTLFIGSRTDQLSVQIGTATTPTGAIAITGAGTRFVVDSDPGGFGNPKTSTTIFCGSLTVGAGATVALGGNFDKSLIDTTKTVGATVTVNGRLKGVGRVNATAMPTGTGKIQRGVKIRPGRGTLTPGDDPGVLTISGGLEMDAGSVFSPVIEGNLPAVEGGSLNGYSMVNVTDSGTQLIDDLSYQTDGLGNTAAGPVLAPELDYIPSAGDTLYLMANNGFGPDVPGFFYDLNGNILGPDDNHEIFVQSTVDSNYYEFRVDYHGNFQSSSLSGGNDLVLIAVPEPPTALMLMFAPAAGWCLRRRRAA